MAILPRVVLLMGPTASGKTALGIEIAKALKGEVISVDSALVYRGMDIGTAKPDMEERQGIKHHLIDIIDPSESFSAGQFREQTLKLINEVSRRGKTPVLVGGTMLYFHVLLNGIAQLPEADNTIRRQIDQQAKSSGWKALHEQLRKIDPKAANRIHQNDTQRIQRALEVYRASGKTQSAWLEEQAKQPLPFNAVKFAIVPGNRVELHHKISLRMDLMLNNGFLDEVRLLFERGDLAANMPAIRSVGYRQAWSYLEGKYDETTFREKAIIATRQLAKRQFTWLRQQSDTMRFEMGDNQALAKVVEEFNRVDLKKKQNALIN
ncbi:MAG: tRNA (adenosine(37)-N6)-dimethylallyltransferase MiaA [Cycloclasticus sp.]|nr:tRNA (adenosine(37)-N6)-dimethylallyltransferase MiaA [Cycloclasticus sp.]MBG95550.1 tRNA (adenosine(37)-N6)-dimethylallyltransferase MiaA [Cycloclasticus sp.]HAI96932.1 tRNA (adenosine(37)-N6)-dimethylallyltransferase MiaA [Methylococcaceae bacterium]|tara:strand:- start:847 stop:1809 length:963 start_codon:yes stop_codon:yes gene_type:complete